MIEYGQREILQPFMNTMSIRRMPPHIMWRKISDTFCTGLDPFIANMTLIISVCFYTPRIRI